MKPVAWTAATLSALLLAVPLLAGSAMAQGTSPDNRPATMPPSTTAPVAPKTTTSPNILVDINSASSSDLDALPGIGKARADAIVKNRPYKRKDELVSRHILTSKVYDGIKDRIIARQG